MFLTLEGGDAAGKTTQAIALEQWITGLGRTVLRTREPGATPLGSGIRDLVLHGTEPISPRAEALLYAADRAHHVATVVRPAIARGDVVIQDRYLDSSIAYQGAGRVLDAEEVRALSTWATEGLLPDRTILLDVDPAVARHRRGGRAAEDRLEAEHDEFHERVRAAFLALAAASPDRFLVIDGGRPADEVAAVIRAAVEPLLVP